MAIVQGVYLALFGRPADAGGLSYWNGVSKNGDDLGAMLKELPALPEYTGRFTNMSNEQIVNSIYQALFGRDAEPAGLAGFVAALNNKTQTISSIAVNILDGAQGSDKARIDAKLAASDIFSAHMDLPAEQSAYTANTLQIAKDYLSAVTENTPGTDALADAAIAKMVQQGGGQQNGGDGGANLAPEFLSGAEGSVTEHASVDTIIYTASAKDDTSGVTYSLTGLDAGKFSIDPITGDVKLNTPADFELDSAYEIGVRAQDSTGFATVKDVTISVKDKVEAATGNMDIIHWSGSQATVIDGLGGGDSIKGGTGKDQIRGNFGNDSIDLINGGKDTVVFESSGAANGTDTITSFTAGNGAEGDIFNLSLFLPGGSLETENMFNVVDSGAVSLAFNAAKLWLQTATADTVADQFGAGDPFSLAVGTKAVVVTGWDSSDVQVWFVNNAVGNDVTASEVKLVGNATLADGVWLDSVTGQNFAF